MKYTFLSSQQKLGVAPGGTERMASAISENQILTKYFTLDHDWSTVNFILSGKFQFSVIKI